MTNIGTIPEESYITVKIGEQIVGKIDEGFLERYASRRCVCLRRKCVYVQVFTGHDRAGKRFRQPVADSPQLVFRDLAVII